MRHPEREDQVTMAVEDRRGRVLKSWGSHANLERAIRFAATRGYTAGGRRKSRRNAKLRATKRKRADGSWDLYVDGHLTITQESFAVVDQAADGINHGGHDPTSEVGEIVEAHRARGGVVAQANRAGRRVFYAPISDTIRQAPENYLLAVRRRDGLWHATPDKASTINAHSLGIVLDQVQGGRKRSIKAVVDGIEEGFWGTVGSGKRRRRNPGGRHVLVAVNAADGATYYYGGHDFWTGTAAKALRFKSRTSSGAWAAAGEAHESWRRFTRSRRAKKPTWVMLSKGGRRASRRNATKTITREQWARKHKDFKGIHYDEHGVGTRHWLEYDPQRGTVSVPVIVKGMKAPPRRRRTNPARRRPPVPKYLLLRKGGKLRLWQVEKGGSIVQDNLRFMRQGYQHIRAFSRKDVAMRALRRMERS